MKWKIIDTQDDFNYLGQCVCWEDSESIEYYATILNEEYFPNDINRSGYINKNLHILFRTDSSKGDYLEMVCIDCDRFASHFPDHFFVQGHVGPLKRVEIEDAKGNLQLRCSRLIYRFLSEQINEGGYFINKKTEPI